MNIEIRPRAIGMIEGGIRDKEVANRLSKGIATVKRWWKRYQ